MESCLSWWSKVVFSVFSAGLRVPRLPEPRFHFSYTEVNATKDREAVTQK